jgi:ubiquinone/menaquinone biosynthesis C-methylase UbiE
MPAADALSRFSNRVADYMRSRPGYPPAVLDLLKKEIGFIPTMVVADIGSGTGKSSELFLENGNIVYAVEPNAEMRGAAETLLATFPNFRSVNGSAEATMLPDSSVDAITAGQAFHWFEVTKARAEFRRILRDNGPVILMWNTPKEDSTPFMRAYIQLLRTYGTDYKQVVHTNLKQEELKAFYGGPCEYQVLSNDQFFDREGLHSRLMSSSYVPPAGHKNHEVVLREVDRLFDEHNQGGKVRFVIETEVYFGRLAPESSRGA